MMQYNKLGVGLAAPYWVEVSTGTRAIAWQKKGDDVKFADDITLDEAKKVIVQLIESLTKESGKHLK